ncbi:MAG: hypothetical protein J7L96_03535 [Bacteroidales bacterium]|nr:hypothetical protein [Bacteroidales bacterium]
MAGLTKKDRGLLKLAVDCNHNETEMGRRLGISHQAVNSRLQKIQKKVSFAELMDNMGLTDDYLTSKLREGMSATKKIIKIKQIKGTKKTKTEIIEVPDMSIRHKYIHTALESKKIIRDPKDTNNHIIGISINYGHRKDSRRDDSAVRDITDDARS